MGVIFWVSVISLIIEIVVFYGRSKKDVVIIVSILAVITIIFGVLDDLVDTNTDQATDRNERKLEDTDFSSTSENEENTTITTDDSEKDSTYESENTDLNDQIDDHLIEDKGFASGTLDENGNKTDADTPNPEFNWALTMDDIKYSDNFLTITVNDKFLDYNAYDAQDALNRAQNSAYQFIGEDEDWNEEKYRGGIYTSVKYNNNQVAESKLTNTKEFKWKE